MNETTNAQIEKSEFNIGIATMERINQILGAAAECSQDRRLGDWYNILLILSKEIDYKFTEKEETTSFSFRKTLNPLDAEYGIYRAKGLLHNFKDAPYFYEVLRIYERFLRKSLDRRDMLMKIKEGKGSVLAKRR